MNPLGTALKQKIGQVKDTLSGRSTVDNAANPTSAYSMALRKQKMSPITSKGGVAGKTPAAVGVGVR